ncbi:GMP reductase, partial [Xanthomonas citri pv. citri]|nr:GMP reductase [Xanthomonas citri pv. citri]
FIEKLAQEKLIPEYITIDIAHGHSDSVINMIKHIKTHIPDSFVIAGNVGTPEGVRELENAGADATKVGIGPGRVCITKI